mgnify:CR=1 FL=1
MNENGHGNKISEVNVKSEMLEGGRVNTVVHSENPNLGTLFSILMEGVAVIIRRYCEMTGADPYSMRDYAFEYLGEAIEDYLANGNKEIPL